MASLLKHMVEERSGLAQARTAQSFSPNTTPKTSALLAGTQSQFRLALTNTQTASKQSQSFVGSASRPHTLAGVGTGSFSPSLHGATDTERYTSTMTETPTTLIEEIESFLALTAQRDLFSSQEIQDLLLDLRLLCESDLN